MKGFAALCRNLKALVVAAVAGSAGAQAQVTPDADTAAWEAAQATGSVEACQRYLEEFPAGRYAEQAFRCIVEQTLPAAGPAVGTVAPGLGLY
jgi:hypothetical protein